MFLASVSALKIGFAGNVLLAVGKTAAGWAAGSQALVADGLHSFTDVLSTVISAVGRHVADEPPDRDHPFGHGAADNLAALGVAGVMALAGLFLLHETAGTLLEATLREPGLEAVGVALLGLVVKELMHRHAAAEHARSGSPTILALARDHRSDALASLAALVGILGARAGTPLLDPLAATVIAGLILKLAWETATENVHVLMDREPEIDHLREELSRRAAAADPPMRIRTLRGHEAGNELSLEVDLQVPPEMTVARAHELAHDVETWAKEIDDRVLAAQVHVEPLGEPQGED